MCGGRFSEVTHPYIHINHILYIGVGVWGLSVHTYIVNALSYTIVKGCVVADSQG